MEFNTKNLQIFGYSVDEIDKKISDVMQKYGYASLRISLGIIFFWFGILKPLGVSAANELVANTVFWFPSEIFIPILGVWEMLIGIGLIFRKLNRMAIFLLFLQMPGTMLPLILLPHVTFVVFPWVPTLEGQYIIKNLVLISAGLVIGGTVRSPLPSDEVIHY